MAISAHERFHVLGCAAAWAPHAPALAIPLDGALASPQRVVRVVRSHDGIAVDDDHPWEWNVDAPILFGRPGTITMGYMYCDTRGATYTRTAWIKGIFEARDVAFLLSALHAGHAHFFVPHQIGMEDLVDRKGFVRFTDLDHVWHSLRTLSWCGRDEHRAIPWATIRPLVEARVHEGYDANLAKRTLDPYGGW